MKILHICISAPYIDGWGYQENLLPEYLARQGVESYVVGCADVFPTYLPDEQVEAIKAKGRRYKFGDVNVIRVAAKRLTTTFVIPYGLMDVLREVAPDVIFHHGVNCTSLLVAYRYCKESGCKLLLDNHADKLNISRNKAWVFLYHKLLLKLSLRYMNDGIRRYYGVTHGRCDFLREFYAIEREKIGFLPIGADTEQSERLLDKAELRASYNFGAEDAIVVSGGKMGVDKGTDSLIKAIAELNKKGQSIRLVLFGKFANDGVEELAKREEFVTIFGWCDRQRTLELLKLGDLACWPVHHTTLIEDAVSVATPLLLRKTETTAHLIDGNGFWVDEDLTSPLERFFTDKHLQDATEESARVMRERLSYKVIASQVLNDIVR